MDLQGVAAVITALALGYQIVTTARRDARLNTKVDAVHSSVGVVADEVHTYNNLTMGEKSDADETRRVALIPEGERTPAESDHLKQVPLDE